MLKLNGTPLEIGSWKASVISLVFRRQKGISLTLPISRSSASCFDDFCILPLCGSFGGVFLLLGKVLFLLVLRFSTTTLQFRSNSPQFFLAILGFLPRFMAHVMLLARSLS